MLDLRSIREDPEPARAALARRGAAEQLDELLSLDERRRELLPRSRSAGRTRTAPPIEIAAAKREGEDAEPLIAEMRELSAELKELETELARVESKRATSSPRRCPTFPTRTHPREAGGGRRDAPRGRRAAGVRLRDPRPPGPRGANGWIEMEKAAEASGSRFAYLLGDLVMVELALVRFALELLRAEGMTPVVPPVLVREGPLFGTGFFPGEREMIYEVPRDELFLVGTSEVSLAALHAGEILAARRAAASLRGLLHLLPARGRRGGQGHARDLPRPPVRQGRDVLVRRARRPQRQSTSACSRSRSASCRRSSSPTGSSTSRSATSAPRPRGSSTARRGSRARSATARSPRARTPPTTRRAAWTAATAPSRRRSRSRCTR